MSNDSHSQPSFDEAGDSYDNTVPEVSEDENEDLTEKSLEYVEGAGKMYKKEEAGKMTKPELGIKSGKEMARKPNKIERASKSGNELTGKSSFATFRWRRRSTASHIKFRTQILIGRRFRYKL